MEHVVHEFWLPPCVGSASALNPSTVVTVPSQVQTLGSGSFGVVHKARDRETGEYVAIKQLFPMGGSDCGLSSASLREVNALKALQHENIVR